MFYISGEIQCRFDFQSMQIVNWERNSHYLIKVEETSSSREGPSRRPTQGSKMKKKLYAKGHFN